MVSFSHARLGFPPEIPQMLGQSKWVKWTGPKLTLSGITHFWSFSVVNHFIFAASTLDPSLLYNRDCLVTPRTSDWCNSGSTNLSAFGSTCGQHSERQQIGTFVVWTPGFFFPIVTEILLIFQSPFSSRFPIYGPMFHLYGPGTASFISQGHVNVDSRAAVVGWCGPHVPKSIWDVKVWCCSTLVRMRRSRKSLSSHSLSNAIKYPMGPKMNRSNTRLGFLVGYLILR